MRVVQGPSPVGTYVLHPTSDKLWGGYCQMTAEQLHHHLAGATDDEGGGLHLPSSAVARTDEVPPLRS